MSTNDKAAARKKIFCFNNGGSPGWYSAVAICEDGHVLAGHICSDEGYMPHDLGITSSWKHDSYDKHCGKDNYDLVWIENIEDERLEAAVRKNKELPIVKKAATQ